MKFAPAIATFCCTVSCFAQANDIAEIVLQTNNQHTAKRSMCLSEKYQKMLSENLAFVAKIAQDPCLAKNNAAKIYRNMNENLQREGFDQVFPHEQQYLSAQSYFSSVTRYSSFQTCLETAFYLEQQGQEAISEWKRARKVGLHICSSLLTRKSKGALRFPLDEPKQHEEFIERFFKPNANLEPEHATLIKIGMLNIYALMQLTDACKEAAIKARPEILKPVTAETTSTPGQ